MAVKSAYIIVGFSEGGWHVQQFERGLRRHGYQIIQDAAKADYVIAHSGGCYTIPPLKDSQLLMLINPTYWPGRSLASRAGNMALQLIKAVRPGNRPFYQVWKTLHNIFYLVYYYRLNWAMIERAQLYNLEESINHGRTILVRNNEDPWLTPQLNTLQKLHPKLQIARLPGEHDDCWLNPTPYIQLLDGAA